jgi:hypothetical protein
VLEKARASAKPSQAVTMMIVAAVRSSLLATAMRIGIS